MAEFVQLNGNRPGGGAVPVPPRPPPPPNQGAPRPNVVNPNIVNVQPQPMQVVHPPPPPRQVVPQHLQMRPLVETSDIRRDLFTEEDAREELASYAVCRFARADEDYQRDGWWKGEPWEQVKREFLRIENQNEVKRKMRDLKRSKKGRKTVAERKDDLSANQQRQVEKIEAELNATDRDPQRYHHVLWHLEEKTRRWDPRKDKEITRSSGKHSRSKSRKRSGSSEPAFLVGWGRRNSNEKKRVHKVRVSITAYYKRLPREGQPTLLMLKQMEQLQAHMRQVQGMQVFPQQMNQGQVRQPMQQQQQQQQQQHGKQPVVVVGGGGKNGEKKYPAKAEKKYPHQSPKRHNSPHRHASPRSSHSSLSYDYSGSDSDTSFTHYSSDRGRKRGSRYVEDPAHFGIPLNHRRHSRYDDHRILDDMPRVPLPPNRLIGGPAVSQDEADRIEAYAYEAGKADGRAEHASVDLALSRYGRPPPRIIQHHRPAVRFVRPGDPRDLEEEHFIRRREEERERLERLEDDEYHVRGLMSELEIEKEELMLKQESIMEREERLRDLEHRSRASSYHRRASSPGVRFENPFAQMRRRPTAF